MCNFLSALVLRNGDILTHPMIDSHSELVEHFKVPDATHTHQHTVSEIRGGTVSEIKEHPFYTLVLSDQAKAFLRERGVLKEAK